MQEPPLQAGWSVAERLRYRLGRGRHYNTSSPVVAAKSAACEHVLETAPLFAATAARSSSGEAEHDKARV